MSDETRETHPSYGMFGVHRVSCGGGVSLFGSSITHKNTIRITIRKGELIRNLHHTRYFGWEELIEVEMSPVQFAEAITGMNIGTGVPCTIKHIGGKDMPPCPFDDERARFEREFDKDMKDLAKGMDDGIAKAKELLAKKSLNKEDKEAILAILTKAKSRIASDIPFLQSSFNEAIDKTVHEAKGEVEAFITNKVIAFGQEALIKGGAGVQLLTHQE